MHQCPGPQLIEPHVGQFNGYVHVYRISADHVIIANATFENHQRGCHHLVFRPIS